MSITTFHAKRISKIKYSKTTIPLHTIADFYNDFLVNGKRLPSSNIIEKWNDLLTQYISDPTAKTFIVRKYSGGKENGKWNNRRGAVVRFIDGFEIVYADNFLAHEIYLMAYHGVVPTYKEFKELIEKRNLPITSGTDVEKQIRLYPSANKTCGCYLAHIADVNGKYMRDNTKIAIELSSAESERLYPLGSPNDWINSADKIYHVDYKLTDEEKSLVKAHFIRFLNPMNHFVTPETKHTIHSLTPWAKKKNIGEYSHLTYYVHEQNKITFGDKYEKFLDLAKIQHNPPAGHTGTEAIDLEINFSIDSSLTSPNPSPTTKMSATKSAITKDTVLCEYIPADMNKFKDLFTASGLVRILIIYKDGTTENKTWECRNITQSTNIKGNLRSKKWYKDNKDKIEKIVCEVV